MCNKTNIDMNQAIILKKITLAKETAKMFSSGKVRSQEDIVQIARVWMTDLSISFKHALTLIDEIVTTLNAA